MNIEQTLKELAEHIAATQKKKKSWQPGEDWVTYSGDVFGAEEYLAALESIVDGWLVFGKNGSKFEKEFPELLGKKRGILTNSGSSANLLMVAALKSKSYYDLPEGSKFITPVSCFPTTVNPLIQNGYIPIFVDVTLPDLNLDLDQVERVLAEDPEIKGIAFAHVLGNPPNMDRLMKLVEKHDLIFLEDACDALGSTYKGRKLGSYGHMSSCSFYPAHHMTLGEGGFVATNNPRLHKILSSLRDWGRACYCNTMKAGCVVGETACGNRFRPWLKKTPEIIYDHRYVYSEIGYNLKPIEMQASIGLQQIKRLPYLEAKRRENFSKLTAVFSKYEKYFHLPKATDGSDPSWFAYLLTVKDDAPFTRSDIVSYLESAKIQTRTYFSGNLLLHPAYTHLAIDKDPVKDFPIASLVAKSSFFMGVYAGIDEDKISYIKKVVDQFFEEIK
jgi:CDP-6-deoxy-D-xylo-4-hexulose-3-dehydrase